MSKLEQGIKAGTVVPSSGSELGTRINEVVSALGTKKYAASVADMSEDMLHRYIRGSSKAAFDPLARLCLSSGISMEWLATGQGEKYIKNQINNADHRRTEIDHSFLSEVIAFVELWLREQQRDMPIEKKAEVISMIYETSLDSKSDNELTVDKRNAARFLKLVS